MITRSMVVALLVMFPTIAYGGTMNYGDIVFDQSVSTFQAGHFSEVIDLTKSDIVVKYRIDLSDVSQSGANVTPYTEIGMRQVGAGDFNPGPFNTYQGGAGGWMTSLVGDLATNPNLQDLDDKHNLNASGGRGEGDYDALDPDTVVSPFGSFSNKGIWFDRDGVDPFQDDSAANTGGIYDVEISYHAISDTMGTMFATVNGMTTGFDTTSSDGFNIDTDPAGLSFLGDMTQMQIFYGTWWMQGAGGTVVVSDLTTRVVPLPAAVWAGLSMLGCLAGVRKLRRKG